MKQTETKDNGKPNIHRAEGSSKHPQGAKKRTIPPEQLEKMRLARVANAKIRKEEREKNKLAQKQAIEQQKERIELLKITKKKKAEIKRRLAEVKKGETKLEEVEELIDTYQPNQVKEDVVKDEKEEEDQTQAREGVPAPPKEGNEEAEDIPLSAEHELSDAEGIPSGDEDDEDALRLEIEEIKQTELKEKIKTIKAKEEAKIKKLEDETFVFEDYYKQAVKLIMDKLPQESKKYFKDETDNFNPKLDVEQNIENMINNINEKIDKNIEAVKVTKKTLEDIEEKQSEKKEVENVKVTPLTIKKKMLNERLQSLYKLR